IQDLQPAVGRSRCLTRFTLRGTSNKQTEQAVIRQGRDDRSDSPNMSGGSGGSGGSGQGSHQAGLEEEQTAAVQEVEEGATMTLRLEKSPLTPWKKERGGRKKSFSPEGERPDRRRQMN
ncbi:hypothetical protein HID58_083916, partial [Brassica napus]